jgi:hypothetical protein
MWNVNQEFRGDVTVVGNYTTIGVNYSHRGKVFPILTSWK